ncbi:MAG: DUF885 domain-containing protein [Acidobacteriota bacterium]
MQSRGFRSAGSSEGSRGIARRPLRHPLRRALRWALTIFLGSGLLLSAGIEARAESEGDLSASSSSPEELLHQVFDDFWQWNLERRPIAASQIGDSRYGDRLPDHSPQAFEQEAQDLQAFLDRVEAIDRGELGVEDQLSYDLFLRLRGDDLENIRFGAHRLAITNRVGLHLELLRLPSTTLFFGIEDYEKYLDRLRATPAAIDDRIALLQEGIDSGWVAPRAAVSTVSGWLAEQSSVEPEKSVLYSPFLRLPESLDEATRERLQEEGRKAIAESVLPAFATLKEFFDESYYPATREAPGALGLPQGKEYYQFRVRHFTTLDVTAEEVHQTGLEEVARIRQEMQAIVEAVEFEADLAAFFEYLRTDPKFYPETAEELLAAASHISKRADGQLPALFGHLPRTPYGVLPIPDFLAPHTTTAYYQPSSGDGRRAGFYMVNTYALESRPLYELEALTLHEAVPGHHLQIAIQQEIEGLPIFRRFAGVGAYIEGWALYAERLGLEMGFYTDPYSDFGRLSYEMWRAARLVVDTGIHAFGWSRQRAIDYMAENTGLTLHNINTEVDRYIGWPGQALGYKMGEIEIRRLRALAEAELGEDFDLRAFHDRILASGPIPLNSVAERVVDWVNEVRSAKVDSDAEVEGAR